MNTFSSRCGLSYFAVLVPSIAFAVCVCFFFSGDLFIHFLFIFIWMWLKSKCLRFVRNGSGSTSYRFLVPGDGCGTQSVAGKLKLGYYNVLVVQIEEAVQEVWDSSRRIQCIFDPASKLIAFQPLLNVDSTDAPLEEEGKQVLTSVLTGNGLDGRPVEQDAVLKIGDPLTLVYHIPEDNYKDMFIKNCFASDGLTNRVRLTDDNGCSLRPKLMEPFKRSGSVAYASLTSFRIADKSSLHLACEVELCRHPCRNTTVVCATEYVPAPTLPVPTIQVSPLTTTTSRPIYSTTPGYYHYTKPPYPVLRPTYGPVVCRPGYSHPQCPPVNYSPANPCQGRYGYACPPRYHNPVVHWKATGRYPVISPLKKLTGK